MLGKPLEGGQTGDICTGQLDCRQRLTVVQPAEELSDFRFCHSFIVVDREVVVFDTIPHPFRQLREIHSADIFHAPIVIHDNRGIGGQRKYIMEKFADGI